MVQKDLLLYIVNDPSLFINAILNSIENEKDPRNLVIGFDLIYFSL